ncbi:PP2C family protein-serine/threonine phosphatase [Streptomyces sp. NPDC127068]|uniref:PP2C family protein-serine/threonine phosphatase n=1 Tax=Streptomyces sp. NPDC127068 TaxID=3347127 RepID=UPI00365F570E
MIRSSAGVPPWVRSSARVLGLPTLWGAIAVTYKLVCPLAREAGIEARLVNGAVFFAVGTGFVVHVRTVVQREVQQALRVARAAQNALLRPLPARIDGLALAGGRLSVERDACVGGDLYDVLATEYGVRIVMGDVRGHGLAALSTVAAVIGSFREAGHDEPELAGVVRRLDRALARHLDDRARLDPAPDGPVAEEFVSLLVVEIDPAGEVVAVNCGHPWPYRLRALAGPRGARGRAFPVTEADPLPPLGLFPLPAELPLVRCGRLLSGEALFLHTDGAADARDRRGRFFPLEVALLDAIRSVPLSPDGVVRAVFGQLTRHVSGAPADDVALLVLRNDRVGVGTRSGPPSPRPAHRVI